MPDQPATPMLASVHHGALQIAAVHVDAYNAELRDAEGLVGDKASKRAFATILDNWRERLRTVGEDPLGDTPTDRLGKNRLDKLLTGNTDDREAANLVRTAVEEFARELAGVVRRFLQLEGWRDTQRIAVGGGLRASHVGELAISRAAALLRTNGPAVELRPINRHPDEAGLIGSVRLASPCLGNEHDSILAVDIGGTNIRAGLVELNLKQAGDRSAARVAALERWRHGDDTPDRDVVVDQLAGMLRDLARRAKQDGRRLAPLVGIGCPGLIRADGSIATGGQNLPGGDWESAGFNLPHRLCRLLPDIGGEATVVLVHNDAVVQELSETPCMRDVKHWGVLTIGTGFGNARFTNRNVAGNGEPASVSGNPMERR